jgi:precorrin-2 dehydrogenase/sirohydrochlorin ferrochelatase
MVFLPISINITDKKILLIGGGRIALHKIGFLEQFTNNISIVALEVIDEIKEKGYQFTEKPYEKSDLRGAFLIYACTNLTYLNLKVKADAQDLGILVNLVDNPSFCDFVSPAIYKHDNMTVAVGSNGQDVYRSVAMRNKIKEYLEYDPAIFYQPVK